MAPADHIDRPPSFMSIATLARELDMSESTVRDMVRRGVLPPPRRLSNQCIRYCWADVQRALGSMTPGADALDVDPYMTGVRNATRP